MMQIYTIFYKKNNSLKYTYIAAKNKKHAKDIFMSKGLDETEIVEMKNLDNIFYRLKR